jgi:hypothetical protein
MDEQMAAIETLNDEPHNDSQYYYYDNEEAGGNDYSETAGFSTPQLERY